MEGRDRRLQRREIDWHRNRPAALALVATRRMQAHAVLRFVVYSRLVCRWLIGLGGWAVYQLWRDRRRRREATKVEMGMAISKRLERDQFGQLHVEYFVTAPQVMDHGFGGLLLLGEVSALIEST